MMDTVPYTKLSKCQSDKCLTMLRRANTLLKKWSESFGVRKSRELRKVLFSGHKNASVMAEVEGKIPPAMLDQFRKERQFIIAIHVTEYPDLDHRTVEYAMLCGFSALARKHAKRWFSQAGEGRNGMSLSDYLNEAYIALVDAIYGYTREDINFTSFAWAALKNRMICATNKSNLFCPLNNSDLELLTKFENTRRSFNERVTFDMVAQAMDLNNKQYKVLDSIMTKVYSESQIVSKDNHGDGTGNDYTSLRPIRHATENNGRILKMNVQDAINKAGLTEFERIVLETSMSPYYGWQSDVARTNVNPTTGKPYTRMWVGYALKNAQNKVRAILVA